MSRPKRKPNDECYPNALRNIKTAPDILYYIGDITACENVVIAVVGKRDARSF